ncbi:MAG: phosphatase PAP2 family protein [Candidatus Methanoperedens sp.]|nr:phosphatase PAP2 family protein [Candidatus Methanoperedens sp.]
MFFKTISDIFSEPAYILLTSLIFWCFSKKTGIRAMYVILFSALMAIYAKNLFSMPRPPEELHKIRENGFGFPSGHALVSSGFWGYMGFGTKNTRLIIAGAIAIISVSLSRIYLGVHYAGDVLGGIIFGLSAALIFFKIEPVVTNKLEKLNRISRYLVAVLFPVVLVAIALMQNNFLKEQAEIGLVMAGIGAGYLLEEERIGFTDAKNNKQRISRALTGIAVLGITYLVSSLLFLINPTLIFLKYAALGFAATFIAPWIITKTEIRFYPEQ